MALRKEAAERSRAQQEAEDERARLTSQAEGERARLTARAEEERASAMRMQQQLAQAREAARSLEAELQAEKVRLRLLPCLRLGWCARIIVQMGFGDVSPQAAYEVAQSSCSPSWVRCLRLCLLGGILWIAHPGLHIRR